MTTGTADGSGEEEVPLPGGTHSETVRVGGTVRRVGRPWSGSVLALLRHLEDAGCRGVPRALGVDEQGREVLAYVEGEAALMLPDVDEGRLTDPGHWVWRDDVLVHLGRLLREVHDAAATFAWEGRTWQVPVEHPVETVCHHDLSPANVLLRGGVPAALVDWEAAAPGPRARDLGFAAWRWVPLWPDERCRAAGLPTGTQEKARRLALLLGAYGVEPDLALVATTVDRMRQFREHLAGLVAAGSAWEVALARRGVLAAMDDEIAWVERHAAALAGGAGPPPRRDAGG